MRWCAARIVHKVIKVCTVSVGRARVKSTRNWPGPFGFHRMEHFPSHIVQAESTVKTLSLNVLYWKVNQMVRDAVDVNMSMEWPGSAATTVSVLNCACTISYCSHAVDGNNTERWIGLWKNYHRYTSPYKTFKLKFFVEELVWTIRNGLRTSKLNFSS